MIRRTRPIPGGLNNFGRSQIEGLDEGWPPKIGI